MFRIFISYVDKILNDILLELIISARTYDMFTLEIWQIMNKKIILHNL